MTPVPDNAPPPADAPSPRRGWQNTPGWVAGLALLLVVACVILRTGFATRDVGSKDETESVEKTFTAVQVTKTAYALSRMVIPGSASDKTLQAASPTRLADDAVRDWKQIANSSFAHTADWRRYALTLSLFHRPGISEALSHIGAARAADQARLDRLKTRSARSRRAQAAEVPAVEEVALWKALYGSRPILAGHVAALRMVIERLNLGWFEHAALAQLYERAGQKSQASQELTAAYRAASLVTTYTSFEVGLLMLGAIGLLIVGLLWVLNRASGSRPGKDYSGYPPAPGYVAGYAHPSLIPEPPPLPSLLVEAPTGRPLPSFSYRARTIAFSIYMAVFMLIGLPLRLMRPLFDDWSAGALSRFNTVLEILIYVPVVGIALWALRRLAAAESPSGTLPTWRETFTALGMTSDRPLADIGAGAFNYVLLMPVFFAVSALSHKLFEHYHTPINPVQFESMMAQSNVDRLLLLLITAVAAPIVEELMFRGLLFPALKSTWGKIGGALLSGAVFAAVHPTIPSGFLPIMLLGVAFALTYERRGSLLANIVMHGIHNGLILLTVFLIFAR
jgi:membrane protease YdiL (CAAX protease family)